MHKELKPCPFCGGTAEIVSVTCDESDFDGYITACNGCKCSTPLFDSESEAADCWNNRTASERERNLLKVLSSAFDIWENEINLHSERMETILAARNLLKQYANSHSS